jgi:hypothetical protein
MTGQCHIAKAHHSCRADSAASVFHRRGCMRYRQTLSLINQHTVSPLRAKHGTALGQQTRRQAGGRVDPPAIFDHSRIEIKRIRMIAMLS